MVASRDKLLLKLVAFNAAWRESALALRNEGFHFCGVPNEPIPQEKLRLLYEPGRIFQIL